MIRAFVAVDLPDVLRDTLAATQGRLKCAQTGVKVTWTKIENLHLTLQFLGDVDEAIVATLGAALTDLAGRQAAFDVPVSGAGAFPSLNRPRVLWIGCVSERLAALARDVQTAMQQFGFVPEHREFNAHLTLGRIKFPRPDAALTRALDSLTNQTFGTLRVEAIHLYQSQLHPEGSIYTKLSSHSLKGD